MAVAWVRDVEGSVVGTTLTINIEASGTDAVLIFGVGYKSTSVLTETSLFFNGAEAFSIERRAADGGDAQVSLWVLTGPTLTTANAELIMPSSVRMVGYAACFSGVNQSSPFTANTTEANAVDANPTLSITSAADEICVSIMAMVSNHPNTIVTNTGTLMCNGAAIGGGSDIRGGAQREAGAASRLMDFTTDDSDNWNLIAAALQEPSAGPDIRPLAFDHNAMMGHQ